MLEAQQHLGDNLVRCVALSATDGLKRGLEAEDTMNPISVPVGEKTLGRMFNVFFLPNVFLVLKRETSVLNSSKI